MLMSVFLSATSNSHPSGIRPSKNGNSTELVYASACKGNVVRDLEQGKETLRLDKVNQLLDFFNYEMVATVKQDNQ